MVCFIHLHTNKIIVYFKMLQGTMRIFYHFFARSHWICVHKTLCLNFNSTLFWMTIIWTKKIPWKDSALRVSNHFKNRTKRSPQFSEKKIRSQNSAGCELTVIGSPRGSETYRGPPSSYEPGVIAPIYSSNAIAAKAWSEDIGQWHVA